MNSNAQIFILCEDTAHYHFARKYFQLLGFKKISGNYNQKGKSIGSGAELVKNRYEIEVKGFHSRSTYLDYILVVIIDDDTIDNAKNLYQKYKPLPNEKILIFSPVRNIQSWIHYINTGNYEVEIPDKNGKIKDYKPQYNENCKHAKYAKELKKICDNGLPENAPSSLHHACKQLEKL